MVFNGDIDYSNPYIHSTTVLCDMYMKQKTISGGCTCTDVPVHVYDTSSHAEEKKHTKRNLRTCMDIQY